MTIQVNVAEKSQNYIHKTLRLHCTVLTNLHENLQQICTKQMSCEFPRLSFSSNKHIPKVPTISAYGRVVYIHILINIRDKMANLP